MSSAEASSSADPKPEGYDPHKLMVDPYNKDDSTVCAFHPSDFAALELMRGGHVLLKGRHGKRTVCIALLDKEAPAGRIRINKLARTNLRVKVRDIIRVHVCTPGNATRVELLPIKDTLEGLSGDLFETFVKPYFVGKFRCVHVGDIIHMPGPLAAVDFQVMAIQGLNTTTNTPEAKQFGIVTNDTEIFTDGEPIERDDAEGADDVGYEDLGGLGDAIVKIREIVELPLRHPVLFSSLGTKPPRGVLLYGPPGCGKTMLARAVACETGAFFFTVNGPEIMGKMQGQAEQNVIEAFTVCESNAPAILFIDELDAIAPNRDKTHGEVERRVVSQLLTCMDGMKDRAHVIVIGATNRPNSIDPALRRFGRFDREIDIGIPDEKGRREILDIKTRNMKLADDVDLQRLAHETHGFVGADVAQLCTEAAMTCIRENFQFLDMDTDTIDVGLLDRLAISHAHFEDALSSINPSALREVVVEVPEVHWDDIGGLEETKRELQEMVLYPVEHPEEFERFGQTASRGVLFYGPPGCGKTLMAKAVATECSANFISVKGPELLTKWFGESEANVRDIFDKARAAAPCILFFDELDSLATQRGMNVGDHGVTDRVINQLLTEMDGIGSKKNVFFIGATNRPDQLDSAVCRPGRLDQLIYIPLPDLEARVGVFTANLKRTPIASDVDLREYAMRTAGFSGADLTEICQKAVRFAIRESIDAFIKEKRRREDAGDEHPDMSDFDPIPEVTRQHFETAFITARKSVKAEDVRIYDRFAENMKRSAGVARATAKAMGSGRRAGPSGSAGGNPSTPTASENPTTSQFQQSGGMDEDDDMYS